MGGAAAHRLVALRAPFFLGQETGAYPERGGHHELCGGEEEPHGLGCRGMEPGSDMWGCGGL